MSDFENPKVFESRKKDHIRSSLDERSQVGLFPSSQVALIHHALPDLNLNEVSIGSPSELFPDAKPLMVSSMTGGHDEAFKVNQSLMEACQERSWIFAAGSMRKEVESLARGKAQALDDWKKLHSDYSGVFIGNLGLAQVITSPVEAVVELCEALSLNGLYIHLNPLQEALQPEGTPNFKGGVEALEKLAAEIKTPIFIKETGTGLSQASFKALSTVKGLKAIDVAGMGGTHWGRVEGLRAKEGSLHEQAAIIFENWGLSTVDSLLEASEANVEGVEVWASGGLRSGLDAAICFALGAKVCGFAQPFMRAALDSKAQILDLMEQIEYELKVALFCTNSQSVQDLQAKDEVLEWL